MLNPIFLRTFLDLAQRKNFTATARALGMTQPGVSQHLRWLEHYVGLPLAIREGRRFELTDAGAKLVAYGSRLFAEHDDFLRELRADDPTTGVCRLASPGSFGMKMYGFVVTLAERHPGLVIHYSFAPNAAILRDLIADSLDLGFVTQRDEDHPELTFVEIEQEKLCLVVPADFAGRSFKSYADLGFVGHPDGAYYANRVLRHLFPKEYSSIEEIPLRGFVNTLVRIPDMVATGRAFTVLPEYACRTYPDQRRIRFFSPKDLRPDTIYYAHRRRRSLPARFNFLLQRYRDLQVEPIATRPKRRRR